MTTFRRRFLRLCGAAGVGAVAGCTDVLPDDGSNESATPVQTPTATLTPSQTPTESATATPNAAETATATETSTEAGVSGTQEAKVAPDDGDDDDRFSVSVAVSNDGTTALIGADEDDDNGSNAGAAYVFTETADSWSEAAKLTADDGQRGDRFGGSVAVSSDGTTALIGADEDDDSGSNAGAAYVFDGSGDSWTQQTKLTPDDGSGGDRFGTSVALSDDGTIALLGASGDDDEGSDAGSAYVFDGAGGSWSEATKLTADDGDGGDRFGNSVAVSNDGATALIGAYEDNDSGPNAGSAYVFDSAGDSWSQQGKLTADDGSSDDTFGGSVSVSGDGTTALIGADKEDDNGSNAGAAYLFDDSGGSWSQQVKLTPGDSDRGDNFGNSVALSDDGTTALIGAQNDEDPNNTAAGSAYLFESASGSWSEASKLAADDGDRSDQFGNSVTLSDDGTTALIGAIGDDDPNGDGAGSAYVFD